jgi:hypothetical protein
MLEDKLLQAYIQAPGEKLCILLVFLMPGGVSSQLLQAPSELTSCMAAQLLLPLCLSNIM